MIDCIVVSAIHLPNVTCSIILLAQRALAEQISQNLKVERTSPTPLLLYLATLTREI